VAWENTITIASFYIDQPKPLRTDVYMASQFPFTRNDPALLVEQDVYPFGVFNLSSPKQGKYLVFMPLDSENPGNLVIREIRVWSEKDLASQGDGITNGDPLFAGRTLDYCIQNACNYFEASTNNFYVDLGSSKLTTGIWVLFGARSHNKFCVSYSLKKPNPTLKELPNNNFCFDVT
jgi:hypothetical protein